MRLLMIVPTRNRPQNAAAAHAAWCDTVSGDSTLLFVVDEDDPQLGTYQNQMTWLSDANLLVGPSGLRMVGALNAAAKGMLADESRYDAIGFMGDDHRPRTRGWDSQLCAALADPVGIAYGNDLLQGEAMATAVVMTANIPRTLGYMVPPCLEHLCADLIWCEWGRALGVLNYLDHVVLEHMHPANGKAQTDAGYEEANNPGQMARDSDAYYAYMAAGFHSDVAKLKELMV